MKTKKYKKKDILRYVMEFYEKDKGRLYESLSKAEDYNNRIMRTIPKFVDIKDKVVLDLGAGTGKFTIPIAKKAKLVYALDISKSLLPILRKKIKTKKIKNIKILKAGYSRIPLPNESVDVIFSGWSFPCHSYNRSKDLKEVKRVLKKGGKIILIEQDNRGEYYNVRKNILFESVQFADEVPRWMMAHGFKRKARIDILINFGSKKNIFEGGSFFGPIFIGYLLGKGKTSIKMGIGFFYWKK